MSNDLLIFSAGVFPIQGQLDHTCRYMIQSCELQGIDLCWYGLNTPEYPGWVDIKLTMPIEYLKSRTEEYVLYTDGQDAFFTRDADYIWQSYCLYGKPNMLVAATKYMFPHEADISIYEDLGGYNYPHVGGYVGRREAIIEVLEKMLVIAKEHNWGDDANCWYEAYKQGWFRPEIDNKCLIFQLADDADLDVSRGSLFNKLTGSFPAILHISGGYNDPKDGKLSAVKPWYEWVYGE